jgi:hypothetical protein
VALYQENLPNDATIQARSGPTKPPIEITRTTAGMPKLLRRDDPEWKPVVAPADWDFEAVPYSSVENNRMIQLRNMRDSWPMLVQGMQMSVVDPRLVFEKLADALMITDTLTDPEAVAQGAVPAGAGMPAPSLGEDTRASGALPPGTEPPGVPLPFGGAGNGGAAPIQVARGTSAFPEG